MNNKQQYLNESQLQNIREIDTKDLRKKLNDKSFKIVDTRITDAYNGWPLDNIKRGGHIPSSVDFSHNWLDIEIKDKEDILQKALDTKGISKDKNIVLYNTNQNYNMKVANYLQSKGYKNIYIYDINRWAEDKTLQMDRYTNYHILLPPQILKQIIDGQTPTTFENSKTIKIVEASWGEAKESYNKGHIPTSVHINTDEVEPPPSWRLASDEELIRFFNNYGFSKEDTIIVTGKDVMASFRIAVVLKYIGVDDVRVLNGGIDTWVNTGYELETSTNERVSNKTFIDTNILNPHIIHTTNQIKENIDIKEFTLVDIRSFREHTGQDTGYTYHDKKGRIPGAVYGYSGTSSITLEEYRNIDNTMKNASEILNMWKSQNIDINSKISFMCGSGWRASEVFTYATVMGLSNIHLYSDGWIGWSSDESNPIEL